MVLSPGLDLRGLIPLSLFREHSQGGRVQVKDFEVELPGLGLGFPVAGLSFAVVSGLSSGFFRKRKKSRMRMAAATPMIAGTSIWRLV